MTDVKKNSLKAWVLAARPKTLTGAAVPVMTGLSLAWLDTQTYERGTFSWTAATLCLLFAFIMQTDANFINDFVDYARGTDDNATRLGPERACAQGWVSTDAMKRAIAVTTGLACLIGLPLIVYGGLEMILIGMLCVMACFLYTTHLSYMGLGDLLVLLFFGIVPVSMTYYVQLHTVTPEVMAGATACGLVIDALLLVNNFRDRDTDRQAGKNTLVVRIGAKAALNTYLAVGIAACALGLTALCYGHYLAFLLPLLYLPLHVQTYLMMKRIDHGHELNKCLDLTARNILVFGVLITVGYILHSIL